MTAIYACSLQPLLEGGWRSVLPALPADRQQRALACRRDADAARLTGAGRLLQQALERHGIPAQRQHFARHPQGKPFLPDHPDLQFSLSHSGPWAVCAVADHPVGVDVEGLRCSAELARRYFHREEAVLAEEADSRCRIWTAKEAFVKALGTGLTIPLDSFLVELTQDGLLLHQSYSSCSYRLHEYRLEDHRICLCCTDEKPELVFLP